MKNKYFDKGSKIDITTYTKQIGDKLQSGELSRKEAARLVKGLATIDSAQKSGVEYEAKDNKTFTAKKDGLDIKGRSSGTNVGGLGLSGRKVSKAMSFIRDSEKGNISQTEGKNPPQQTGDNTNTSSGSDPKAVAAYAQSQMPDTSMFQQPVSVPGKEIPYSEPVVTPPAAAATTTPPVAAKPAAPAGNNKASKPAAKLSPKKESLVLPKGQLPLKGPAVQANSHMPKEDFFGEDPLGVRYDMAGMAGTLQNNQLVPPTIPNPVSRKAEQGLVDQADAAFMAELNKKIQTSSPKEVEAFKKSYKSFIDQRVNQGKQGAGTPAYNLGGGLQVSDYFAPKRNPIGNALSTGYAASKTAQPVGQLPLRTQSSTPNIAANPAFAPQPQMNYTPPSPMGNKREIDFAGGANMMKQSQDGTGSGMKRGVMDYVNLGMGAYGLISSLTAKKPKMPQPKEYNSIIAPVANPDLSREYNEIAMNSRSAGRQMTSDNGANILQKLAVNSQANKAISGLGQYRESYLMQERNRVNGMQNSDKQFNFSNQQKYQDDLYNTQRSDYDSRQQAAGATFQNALSYENQRAADLKNKGIQERMANNRLGFMGEASAYESNNASIMAGNGQLSPEEQQAIRDRYKGYGSNIYQKKLKINALGGIIFKRGGQLSFGEQYTLQNAKQSMDANRRLSELTTEYARLIASVSRQSAESFTRRILQASKKAK